MFLRMSRVYKIRIPLILLGATLVFLPGLGSLFLLDDYSNLLNNHRVQLTFSDPDFWLRSWLSGIADRSFSRQLAFVVFAVEHAVWEGFDPVRMKALNLLIHLVNGFLVYVLVSLFRAKAHLKFLSQGQLKWLPAVVAFLWLISPINIGSVLYVVQRMNLLSATCSLGAILCFVYATGSNGVYQRTAWILLSGLLVFAGFLFKENAILVIPFLAGLMWVTHSFTFKDVSFLKSRGVYIGLGFAVLLGVCTYLIKDEALQLLQLFASRNFDMFDRVLTQPFALFTYLGYALIPIPGRIRFYHDYLVDNPYFSVDPMNWVLIPMLAAILLIVLYLVVIKRNFLVYCTIGWFFLFHALESSILPLEPGYNHRNYLPLVGIFLGATCLVFVFYNRMMGRLSAFLARSIVLTLFLCYSITSIAESFVWGNTFVFHGREADQRPVSSRALYSNASRVLNADDLGMFCNQVFRAYDLVQHYDRESIYGAYGNILAAFRCGYPEKIEPAMETIKERFAEVQVPIGDLVVIDSLSNYCRDEAFMDMGLECQGVQEALQLFISREDAPQHKKYEGFLFLSARIAYENNDILQAQNTALKILEEDPNFVEAHILMLDIHYFYRRCEVIQDSLETYASSQLSLLSQIPGQTYGRYPDCNI